MNILRSFVSRVFRTLVPFFALGTVLLALAGPAFGTGAEWGVNDDTLIGDQHLTAEAMPMISEMGAGWIRIWIYWNRVNPEPNTDPDDFEWDATTAAINSATAAGLNIYATIMWAPAWATGGTGHYTPWYCMDINNPGQYDPAPPGCSDGLPPDIDAFKDFVRAAVSRFPEIRHWGFWNEPSYPIFWHSPGGPYSIVDQILIPGYEAAKEVDPTVVVVGPEALAWADQSTGLLEYALGRDETENFLDVVSVHAYGSNSDPNSLLDFIDYFDNSSVHGGHDVWVTEWGIQAGLTDSERAEQSDKIVQVLEGIQDRTWISKSFLYRLWTDRVSEVPESHAIISHWNGPRPAYFGFLYHIDAANGVYPSFGGHADQLSCAGIRGWAWDGNHENLPLSIDLFVDGDLYSTFSADIFRQDLLNAGIGDGFHGFSIPFPNALKDNQFHDYELRIVGRDYVLSDGSASMRCIRRVGPVQTTAPQMGSLP